MMLKKIYDGRTDLVFDYVQGGGDAKAKDEYGVSLIQWCAYYGDVSAIKFVISRGESLSRLGENFDLNGACFHGHWQLCQFLVESGADVNRALEDTGETPLHAALSKAGRPAYNYVLKLLLNHRADPNRATKKNVSTGALMRDARTKGETPLHRAAAFGDGESIDLLLTAGAVKNAKDMEGDSPLSWASWHQRPAAILQRLCYDDFSISSTAVARNRADHGCGWGNGMENNLLGTPHL